MNHRSGQTITHTFSRQPALCQENAEWIVEDYEEGGELVPLADWGTVTFTGASAGLASGSTGPSGATIINMEQSSGVLTDVTVSGSEVQIAYTGQ